MNAIMKTQQKNKPNIHLLDYLNRHGARGAAMALYLSLFVTLIPAAQATTLSTTNISTSGDWTATIWETNATPGVASGMAGTAVGANSTTGPGNRFEELSNGVVITSGQSLPTVTTVRTPGNAATFPGASLTLNTNTVLKFKALNLATTFANLVLQGGVLCDAGANQRAIISGGVQVVSQSYLSCGGDGNGVGPTVNSGAAYTINAAISGSGNLFLMNSPNNTTNIISGGLNNTFNGCWVIQNGILRGDNVGSLGTNSIIVDPSNTLYLADMPLIAPRVGGAGSAVFDVSYDLNSAGSLILTNGGKMNLRQNCVFGAVSIEGASLSAGTYTYGQLTNSFPGSFLVGGSGSITVRSYNAVWPPYPPGIVTQPKSVVTTTGQSVSLSVTASNSPTGYQWYATNSSGATVLSDGGDLAGSATATLSFTNVTFGDAGNYFVVATNLSGAVTSSVVNVAVYDPTNLPVIASVYPNGTNIYQPASALTFTATSANAGINLSGIQVILNGINVSNSLTIGGSALSRTVSCLLRPNQYYVAAITVTDINGLQASQTYHFDTFSPVLSVEGEDYDFDNGQFTNGIGAYAGLLGVQGVDMNVLTPYGPNTDYIYRPTNQSPQIACVPVGDLPRLAYGTNQDYAVGYFHTGGWMNYTRTVPDGAYNVYARVASGNNGVSITMGLVTNGVGTSSQTAMSLGSFSFNGRGWSSYDFVPLQQNGSLVTVKLNGTNTFRVTASQSEANFNFFVLVPKANDIPQIVNLYPDGSVLLQATNRLSFTASNSVFAISANNIIVTLNGTDVSSQLSVSGSSSAWNVSLPLTLNTNYNAVIKITDNYGNVVSNAYYFDTFSPTNFTVEAEDFDFNGGQYIDNPGIDAYSNQVSTPYVDEWFVNQVAGAPYVYRPSDWISTAIATDKPRQVYLTAGLPDYQVGYWQGGSWINYTHTYPAGTYNVWARLAGGTTYNVQMTNTVNGVATYLGTFNAPGRGWSTYDWVPLKNSGGQVAAVTLGGVSTLTAGTDGNANANFFMLVPTNSVSPPPNPVSISSSLSTDESHLLLSFPTEAGYNYQVYYKTNLTDSTWLLLSTIPGTGGRETVTNSVSNRSGFFRLLIQ